MWVGLHNPDEAVCGPSSDCDDLLRWLDDSAPVNESSYDYLSASNGQACVRMVGYRAYDDWPCAQGFHSLCQYDCPGGAAFETFPMIRFFKKNRARFPRCARRS